MAFHRFTQPSYPGNVTLPAGPSTASFNGQDYNLFNVISGGLGASGSAFADAAKASGPNTGTYMVAFGEDASSSNANRGMRALVENTDYLDDLMNRAIAVPVRTTDATAVSPVTSIVLPAGTFVGNSGSYPMDMLFEIVNDVDDEILDVALEKVVVDNITGAAIGDGYSTSTITLNLASAIPAGVIYRVYYATLSSLAAMPTDALTFIRIRGAQEVSAEVELNFALVKGAFSTYWWSAPLTNLTHQGFAGINQKYRRATTTSDDIPDEHPTAYAVNTAGSGAFYVKDGAGMVAYHKNVESAVSANVDNTLGHAFGAAWCAWQKDIYTVSAVEQRIAFNSGFVFAGRSEMRGTASTPTPGIFAFAHTAQVGNAEAATPANAPGLRTQIRPGTSVSLTGNVLTLGTDDRFRQDLGDGNETDIALGYDIIRITIAGDVHSFHVLSIVSDTTAQLCNLDGSIPDFSAATAGTLKDWHRMMWCQSDNPHDALAGLSFGGSFFNFARGMYYNAERDPDDGSYFGAFARRPAQFFGTSLRDTGPTDDDVIVFGYRAPATGAPTNAGALRASGKAHFLTMSTENWPLFRTYSGGSSAKSYTRRQWLLQDGVSFDSAEYAFTAGYGGLIKLTTNATEFSALIKPHNGCVLTTVVLWFQAATHAGLPQFPVQATVKRTGTLTEFASSVTDANLHASAPVVHSLPSLGDYSAKLQKLTITCDQNNTIDMATYMYQLLVRDENGTDAESGNVFIAIDLTFTAITDMQPA